MNLNMLEVEAIVRRALAEDIGTGDITTAVTIPMSSQSKARIVAKEDGIVAGIPVAAVAFSIVTDSYFFGIKSQTCEESREVIFTPCIPDGGEVSKGDTIAEITGSTAVILTGERVALNFLQRLSGIATKTAHLRSLIAHTNAKLVDTRKTTPGLRIVEKYAVRCGGGSNHRFGLYDAILIKDNHIQASGGIVEAVGRAKAAVPHTIKIEVETDTLEQVALALDAGADLILLDNMTPDQLKKAVELCKGRATTEASGGITEQSIVAVAESGVNLISVGALTHSVISLDLGLDILD